MPEPRRPELSAVKVARAALRLPEIAIDALSELRPMRDELVRVREQTASMPKLLPAIERMEASITDLSRRLGALETTVDALARDVSAMHDALSDMKSNVEQIPGVSDDDRNLLVRARDAVTGGEVRDQ